MKRFAVLIVAFVFGLSLVQAQTFTDSNLPIVVINTDGGVTIPDEPKVPATMKIIWHPDGSRNYLTDLNNPAFLNYDGRIGIERRGTTSQDLPKKPYGLETRLADDVTANNVSILGMPAENDWVLNALAYDETGMRDVLAYSLSEQLGQYAPRRVYCEVMVNGDYKGLYVFMEKIKVDKNRVNIEKMDETCNAYPEVTGGYITKADKQTGGDPVAWYMENYIWDYVKYIHHNPKPENITQQQNDYIKSVFFDLEGRAHSHNESVADGFPALIDVPSFIDFMIMGEYASNVDVYEKSTFFHKDRNGKLRAGPVWDYNLAFGYDAFGNRSGYDVWQFDNNDNVGSKFWYDMFHSPMFRCYLAKRWFEVTAEGMPLNYNVVSARIDELDALLAEAIERDNQRWWAMYSHNYYVQELRNWLQMRINWLNQHIGSYDGCDDVELPPLVISRIHYHPEDWWAINGDHLEFIQINNNGDDDVDLTGIYLRELGITYGFPAGAVLPARDSLVLCSDSVAFRQYYKVKPFGQYTRKLSNKSENLVLADAWGNVIDQVHYYDNDPWPWLADGEGPYLQLIDLNLDNSLPESWTVGDDFTAVDENTVADGFRVYPNPARDHIMIEMVHTPSLRNEFRISNVLGQTLLTGVVDGPIDLSSLPSGLYFITVGGATQKLMVEN